jgi:hypothetical protein
VRGDAEQDGQGNGRGDFLRSRAQILEGKQRKDDRGQPTRAEPADERHAGPVESLVVLPERVVISLTLPLEINSSPVASRNLPMRILVPTASAGQPTVRAK